MTEATAAGKVSPTSSAHSGSPQSRGSNYPYSYLGNSPPLINNPGGNQFNYPPQNFGNAGMPYWNPGYQQHQYGNFYPPAQQFQPQPNFNYNNMNPNQNRYLNPHQQGPRFNNNNNNNRYSNNNQRNNHPNHRQHNNRSPNQPNQNLNSQASNIQPQNNQNRNKNKNKVDKRDLPENNKFYCESCDRGFKTEDKYKEHCDDHETCGVNGCKFTAASRLVEIHYTNFHATGLDKKLNPLQTPEEVQKYREERKKNFPTNQNAEKKSQLDEEKSKRGAILDTKQFSRLNRRQTNQKFGQQKTQGEKDDSKPGEGGASPAGEPQSDDKSPNRFERVNKDKDAKFKKNKNKKNRQKTSKSLQSSRKPTLLQKLLADEIRHERNIILQCVKYVLRNNFFDKARLATVSTKIEEDQSHPVEEPVITNDAPAMDVEQVQPSTSSLPTPTTSME